MKLFLAKFGNLIVFALGIAWFVNKPDWEPGVVVISSLLVWLGMETLPGRKLCTRDGELFQKFLEQFPSNGPSAQFLSDHDIGVNFHSDVLIQLDDFLRVWWNADHEFRSKKLEKKRKLLYEKANKFRRELSLNIGPAHIPPFLTMGMDDYERRSEVMELREKLNRMATDVFSAHQDLVRLGYKLK